MRTVFIEKGSDGEILNSNLYTAFDGFAKRAYDIKFFRHFIPGHVRRGDLVCGTIRSVRQAWRELDMTAPLLLDYPEELQSFLGRNIWETSLGEVRKQIFEGTTEPLFVKPRLSQKLFTGRVLSHPRDLIETTQLEPSTAVWASEPVKFVSEYRAFVLHGQLIGLKHYYGDFGLLVNMDDVLNAIEAYTLAPVAYAIDFGVTSDHQTLVVEVNDSYALGCYGLDSMKYTALIEARWDQLLS